MTDDLRDLTAAELEHLVALKRERERREAERIAEEIAWRDELRTGWRDLVPNLKTIGWYERIGASCG